MDVYKAGHRRGGRRVNARKDRRKFSKYAGSTRRENMVSSAPMRLGIRL